MVRVIISGTDWYRSLGIERIFIRYEDNRRC